MSEHSWTIRNGSRSEIALGKRVVVKVHEWTAGLRVCRLMLVFMIVMGGTRAGRDFEDCDCSSDGRGDEVKCLMIELVYRRGCGVQVLEMVSN